MTATLHLNPSKYLLLIFLSLCVFAIVSALLSGLSFVVSFILCALVILQAIFIVRRDVLLLKGNSIIKIYQGHSGYQLEMRDGHCVNATLKNNSVVFRSVMLLNFKVENATWPRRVLIFSDSENKQSLRRFRIGVQRIGFE